MSEAEFCEFLVNVAFDRSYVSVVFYMLAYFASE